MSLSSDRFQRCRPAGLLMINCVGWFLFVSLWFHTTEACWQAAARRPIPPSQDITAQPGVFKQLCPHTNKHTSSLFSFFFFLVHHHTILHTPVSSPRPGFSGFLHLRSNWMQISFSGWFRFHLHYFQLDVFFVCCVVVSHQNLCCVPTRWLKRSSVQEGNMEICEREIMKAQYFTEAWHISVKYLLLKLVPNLFIKT